MKSLRAVNLNLLPILRELLLEKSVSKASSNLFMSQSATSEALGKLRVIFDDPLLLRSGKNMEITPFASQLQLDVEHLVGQLAEFFDNQNFDVASTERTYTIATADYVTQLIGPALLKRIEAHAPGIHIQFIDIPASGEAQLATGRIDLALAPSGVISHQRIISDPVFNDDYVLIVNNRNKDIGNAISRNQYAKMRHIVFQPGPNVTQSHEVQTLLTMDEKPEIVARVPQFNLLPALIEQTRCVAAIQRRLAEQAVKNHNIRIFESPVPYPKQTIMAYRNSSIERDPAFAWVLEVIFEIGQEVGREIGREVDRRKDPENG